MLDSKKQGSYRVGLNSGKNKTDLQSNFPDPEKVQVLLQVLSKCFLLFFIILFFPL